MTSLPYSPLQRCFLRRWRSTVLGAAALAVTGLFAIPGEAATVYALIQGNRFTTVNTANPAEVRALQAITGLASGDVLAAIDVRPQNQELYGLAINTANNTATFYHLEPRTGVAAAVGAAFQLTDGANIYTLPDPATNKWDIDFNPTSDRVRVV